jgi:hypothetical protein
MARLSLLGTAVFALATVAIPASLSGSPAEVPLSVVSLLGVIACFGCLPDGN